MLYILIDLIIHFFSMSILALYVRYFVFDAVHALSVTSTHFKGELMLYCLHCPTLNKVFLLFFLLLLLQKRVVQPLGSVFYTQNALYLIVSKPLFISWQAGFSI